MAFSWTPKATVQAATAGLLLNALRNSDEEVSEEFLQVGKEILTTGIMSIVFCAPLSAILMNSTGHLLVEKDQIIEKPT